MFGTLRLFLALLVVAGHVPHPGFSFELAVSAVILFYLITGHLMGLKFAAFRRTTTHPIRLFMLDRFFRVYPAYFVVLVVTTILVGTFGPSHSLPARIDALSLLGNLALLPANYYMFMPDFSAYIPQAFSLALEEQFYLVLPFLLVYRRLFPVAIGVGLGFVLTAIGLSVATGTLSKLTGDLWLYRLLPGTLAIFLLGVLVPGRDHPPSPWVKIILMAYAALLFAAFLAGTISSHLVFAVAIGVLVGYPVVSHCAGQARNPWDDALGKGAYGTFLCHITVIWAFQRFLGEWVAVHQFQFRLLVVVFSLAAGFGLYYAVDRPVERWRRMYALDFIKRHPVDNGAGREPIR
ncbi:MAG TPA: acyltransferase [Lacunisphaera sp.]|nr:acyltransferase [Lacunisphaera sp.]